MDRQKKVEKGLQGGWPVILAFDKYIYWSVNIFIVSLK